LSANQNENEQHVHSPNEIFELENRLRETNLRWYEAFSTDPESIKTQHALHAVDKVGEHLATVHNLFPTEESHISLSGMAKAVLSRIFGHKL
jgi:hypothetical protein